MPRLSLYRPNKQNDYKFLDKTIAEMYVVGGVDMHIHKYLGPKATGDDSTDNESDSTQQTFSTENPLFIEDVFLLENRDRSYSDNVYTMRGVYNAQDIDFDLSQFGLFLNNDTLFITFHYNYMIETIGRKLMSGDVLELPNLRDFHPLDPDIAKALPKYYVIEDASFASEGFSQTWLPHLWRVKATPLVASQEYNDILSKPFVVENTWDSGNYYPSGTVVTDGETSYVAVDDVPVGTDITDTDFWQEYEPPSTLDTVSTRSKDIQINDLILQQAETEVPLSGYDTTKFYIVSTNEDGSPGEPGEVTPSSLGWTLGYLTGSTEAPNGLPVTPSVSFPLVPEKGEYVLRLDYFPNRLFRYDGKHWIKVSDDVRSSLTPEFRDTTFRTQMYNNTGTVDTTDRGEIPSRQSLSDLLRPNEDN